MSLIDVVMDSAFPCLLFLCKFFKWRKCVALFFFDILQLLLAARKTKADELVSIQFRLFSKIVKSLAANENIVYLVLIENKIVLLDIVPW